MAKKEKAKETITLETTQNEETLEMLITGGTVMQEETRQAKDFSPNKYATEYNFKLSKPVSITDLKNLSQVSRMAGALQTLCTIGNRKAQIRDGVLPYVSDQIERALKHHVLPNINLSSVVPIGKEQEYIKAEFVNLKSLINQVPSEVTSNSDLPATNAEPVRRRMTSVVNEAVVAQDEIDETEDTLEEVT